MVTNGAGPVIATIDQFENLGLQLAELSDQTKKLMREHYPPTYIIGNPCDVTGSATADSYAFAVPSSSWMTPTWILLCRGSCFKTTLWEESIVDVLS